MRVTPSIVIRPENIRSEGIVVRRLSRLEFDSGVVAMRYEPLCFLRDDSQARRSWTGAAIIVRLSRIVRGILPRSAVGSGSRGLGRDLCSQLEAGWISQ